MRKPTRTARLVFAGGGTGGHLFPAIAIADRITELLAGQNPPTIVFVGTRRGIEYRMRETLAYPLELINIRGIARSFTFKNLLVPFLMVGALLKARSVLETVKPDVVIGTGGYVSWPILKMASWRKIPAVLQEQNSYPGVTTRRLAGGARRIYLGYEEARAFLPSTAHTIVTGNPVRRSVIGGDRREARQTFGLDPDKRTILVLGGSQGARSINRAVLKSLQCDALPEGYQLLWQTGKRDYKEVVAAAGKKARGHSLFPFENRMHLVYAAADAAIARAGAVSLAELQACAVPALLVPYPYAAGDHQRKNARAAVERGFARLVNQEDIEKVDLLEEVVTMFEGGQTEQMRQAMLRQAIDSGPAVDMIAEDIIGLIAQSQEKTLESTASGRTPGNAVCM